MDDFESDRCSLMPQRAIDRRKVLTVSLVSRFRSSPEIEAGPGASFGIIRDTRESYELLV